VIGLGQAAAGDDAVGFAVLEHIRSLGAPAGLELVDAADPTALIALLQTRSRVVVVDAVVGASGVGEVIELDAEALEAWTGGRTLSTHGVSVAQAIELARILGPEVSPRISLVGVSIALPERHTSGLSRAVRSAVPIAAQVVLTLVGG
jgi:hydrogenase maturation protease